MTDNSSLGEDLAAGSRLGGRLDNVVRAASLQDTQVSHGSVPKRDHNTIHLVSHMDRTGREMLK